jgi:hypothetical protein
MLTQEATMTAASASATLRQRILIFGKESEPGIKASKIVHHERAQAGQFRRLRPSAPAQ